MFLTRAKVMGGIAVVITAVVVAVVMSQRSGGTTPPPSSADTSGPENVASCYDSKYYTRYVPNVDGSLADGTAYCDIIGNKWCIIGDEFQEQE